MDTLQLAAVAFGIFLGAAGIAAAFVAYSRVEGVAKSVVILETANAGLIDANAELARKLQAQEHDCDVKIAHLEGQVATFTSSLANQIVVAVLQALDARGTT